MRGIVKNFFIAILFLTFYAYSAFSAELLPEYGKGVMTLTDDFNGDGTKEIVNLKSTGDGNMFNLEIRAGKRTFSMKNIPAGDSPALTGLEKIAVSSKTKPFIGIAFHCGAHSGGLDLYSFDSKSIKKVADFGSDGPSIQFKDVDKDGENEMVTESRDWDTNPVGNRLLETYKYDGKKWKLVSVYETRTKKFLSQKKLATYENR